MSEVHTETDRPILTRRELFDLLCNKVETKKTLHNYVQRKFMLEECSEDIVRCIEATLRVFICDFNRRWKQYYRMKDRFTLKYCKWLDGEVNFPEKVYNLCKANGRNTDSIRPSNLRVGRPLKSFSEIGLKAKQKRVKQLLSGPCRISQEELLVATEMSLRASGKRDAAKILSQVTQTSPNRATNIKRAYHSSNIKPISYTPDEALAFIVNNDLTKSQYNAIRKGAKERHCNIYPSYDVVKQTKLACYPPKNSITLTDISAEIDLQAIVDHTIKRLISVQGEVLKRINFENEIVQMIFKWGCDGSSGQSQYKQKFFDNTVDYNDSNIFMISLVPLQLSSANSEDTENKTILWQNPKPSSTRFCRPIKLLYEKESKEMSKREVNVIEEQIRRLLPTRVVVEEKTLEINQKMLLTMVYGKICNAITDTSSQSCYVCGCTPKEMNNLNLNNAHIDASKFSFGLSILHAYIRFFECILHIAYRVDIKKWQIRNAAEKKDLEMKKKQIIQQFRQEMGLIVDQPKFGGSGTSNDGNTARRFFQDPSRAANITGVDEELIKRSSIILSAISSGFPINTAAFDKFTLDTAKLYIDLYPWYYMPATVHKILIHGAKIVENAILPIGMLSEEAQEARNKHFKRYREKHARKFSRKSNIEDVLHLLLITSDPLISQIDPTYQKAERKAIPDEVRQLLKQPDIPRPPILQRTSSIDSDSDLICPVSGISESSSESE